MHKLLSLALLSTLFGCSTQVAIQHTVAYQAGQDWIQDDLDGAIIFWDEHDQKQIFIQIDDKISPDISIVVDNVLKDTLGKGIAYWAGVNSIGYIHLDTTLVQYPQGYRTCVLAHEMGHSLGMSHVHDIHSLMSDKAQDVNETKCPWSKLDQEDLDRVQ